MGPDTDSQGSDLGFSGEEPKGFEREYSDQGFWEKVFPFVWKTGRGVIEKALQLYFAAQSPETPRPGRSRSSSLP